MHRHSTSDLLPALSLIVAWLGWADPLHAEENPQGAGSDPVVSVGDKGFSLESGDKAFLLRLRALVQIDGRFFVEDAGGPANDTFLARRARIELTGLLSERVEFRVMPDFAPVPSTLLDAWVKLNLRPELQIRAGKVKLPIGLEREQSREHNLFNEFGYPTSLVPNRDIGIDVQGGLGGGALSYYVGAFNGTTDGGSITTTDPDDHKDMAFRLFATPFAKRESSAWKGLGLGVAGTYGEHREVPSAYRSPGQQTFFRFRDGVTIDGVVSRWTAQLYYWSGPFGLIAEHAVSAQELSDGAQRAEVENVAWVATGSWVLTGEEATFRGVKPRRGVGAWQALVRATALEVGGNAFPVFANPSAAAERAVSLGAGLNWYLDGQTRMTLDYNWTEFDGAPLRDENAIVLRTQLRF